MKTVISLALAAGRKRQSPQTGYIHMQDLIPLYDNLCFVLALFRSHIGDQVLEGRALLEKILHFEVDGNFPVNLHEYPHCRDARFNQKIEPLFFWLLKESSFLLGEHLKRKMTLIMEKIPRFAFIENPTTVEEWGDYLIAVQMMDPEEQIPCLEKASSKWNSSLAAYTGVQPHRKEQPLPTLFDYFMGELYGEFSLRALEEDSSHLKAALVQPFSWKPPQSDPSSYILSSEKGLFLAWGDKAHLHTLVTFKDLVSKEGDLIFTLPELIPHENENEEVVFYCNFHPDHTLLVNGRKATSFRCGDRVHIVSKGLQIELSFEVEGIFSGLISKANRPFQAKPEKCEAHDWKIALRTLRRDPHCQVKVSLKTISVHS